MWSYERRLQYPVNIKQTNPELAMVIISQFGGPDGELAASMRYLSQRYAMPYDIGKAVLTDIGVSVSKCPLSSTVISNISTQNPSPLPDVLNFSLIPRGRNFSHISSL